MSKTDSIPRLHHLVPHLGAQLSAVANGATFEERRRLYAHTTDQLANEGKARRVSSSVDHRDAFWSPTQEVLNEAMRLEFIVRQPLPSARGYVDEYRDKPYELTSAGADAAKLYRDNVVEFTTNVTNAAILAHSYFREYLHALYEAPLVCPVVSHGIVANARREHSGRGPVAEWAASVIARGSGRAPSADDVAREMKISQQKRFGKKPVELPTDKALAEALTDAVATASLRARGLQMGPTDLKTLRTWGTELLVVDQSYYVPGFKGANIIWLAGDLTVDSEQDGHTEVKRRGFSEHGARVAQVLIDAYWSQANAAKSNLAAPYLSIYQVRAQAAYEARVTRKLVDRVIESLAKGNYAELGVDTTLHLGAADRWPPSEPIYNRGGRRRFQMTMCRTTRPEVSN